MATVQFSIEIIIFAFIIPPALTVVAPGSLENSPSQVPLASPPHYPPGFEKIAQRLEGSQSSGREKEQTEFEIEIPKEVLAKLIGPGGQGIRDLQSLYGLTRINFDQALICLEKGKVQLLGGLKEQREACQRSIEAFVEGGGPAAPSLSAGTTSAFPHRSAVSPSFVPATPPFLPATPPFLPKQFATPPFLPKQFPPTPFPPMQFQSAQFSPPQFPLNSQPRNKSYFPTSPHFPPTSPHYLPAHFMPPQFLPPQFQLNSQPHDGSHLPPSPHFLHASPYFVPTSLPFPQFSSAQFLPMQHMPMHVAPTQFPVDSHSFHGSPRPASPAFLPTSAHSSPSQLPQFPVDSRSLHGSHRPASPAFLPTSAHSSLSQFPSTQFLPTRFPLGSHLRNGTSLANSPRSLPASPQTLPMQPLRTEFPSLQHLLPTSQFPSTQFPIARFPLDSHLHTGPRLPVSPPSSPASPSILPAHFPPVHFPPTQLPPTQLQPARLPPTQLPPAPKMSWAQMANQPTREPANSEPARQPGGHEGQKQDERSSKFLEFKVPQSFVAFVVGRKGENLGRLQDEFDVNRIFVDGNTVQIVGGSKEQREACRAKIENSITCLEFEIPQGAFDSVTGQEGMSRIRTMQVAFGVSRISITEGTAQIFGGSEEQRKACRKEIEVLVENLGSGGWSQISSQATKQPASRQWFTSFTWSEPRSSVKAKAKNLSLVEQRYTEMGSKPTKANFIESVWLKGHNWPFHSIGPLKDFGLYCWDPNGAPQKKVVDLTVPDILHGLQHMNAPPDKVISIGSLSHKLPLQFPDLPPQIVLNFDPGFLVPLYVARQRGLDLKSIDFVLSPDALNVLATSEEMNSGTNYLVQKCPTTDIIMLCGRYKDSNLADIGFQFKRVMTGALVLDGQTQWTTGVNKTDGVNDDRKFVSLKLVKVGAYNVLVACDVDAIDSFGTVKFKAGLARYFGWKARQFQLLFGGIAAFIHADRTGPNRRILKRVNRKTFEDVFAGEATEKERDIEQPPWVRKTENFTSAENMILENLQALKASSEITADAPLELKIEEGKIALMPYEGDELGLLPSSRVVQELLTSNDLPKSFESLAKSLPKDHPEFAEPGSSFFEILSDTTTEKAEAREAGADEDAASEEAVLMAQTFLHVISMITVALIGILAGSTVIFAGFCFRHSTSTTNEEPLLATHSCARTLGDCANLGRAHVRVYFEV